MDFKPRKSEANIQAELYHRCKENNIDIFLEYCSRWNNKSGSRFDAVIVQNKKIIILIEIKQTSYSDIRHKTWPQSKQGKSYYSFNLPVILICNMKEIDPAIIKIKNILQSNSSF